MKRAVVVASVAVMVTGALAIGMAISKRGTVALVAPASKLAPTTTTTTTVAPTTTTTAPVPVTTTTTTVPTFAGSPFGQMLYVTAPGGQSIAVKLNAFFYDATQVGGPIGTSAMVLQVFNTGSSSFTVDPATDLVATYTDGTIQSPASGSDAPSAIPPPPVPGEMSSFTNTVVYFPMPSSGHFRGVSYTPFDPSSTVTWLGP